MIILLLGLIIPVFILWYNRTRLNQLVCSHIMSPRHSCTMTPLGVSLRLSFSVGLVFRWSGTCEKCGIEYITDGMLPGKYENSAYKKYYPNGPYTWPIDPETGEKMAQWDF